MSVDTPTVAARNALVNGIPSLNGHGFFPKEAELALVSDEKPTGSVADYHQWFPDARYGLFIHWGPYAVYGRGEQVLFREMIPHAEYSAVARAWNPRDFDAREWARTAVEGGFKYAVLTTRHHDGYCLWNTARHDYSSAEQTPHRDFVREYVDAFREAGLRVGLYYSLADWRIPAYFAGPDDDPLGFEIFIDDVHAQVRELLTNYDKIDIMWFDGAWPHCSALWRSAELVAMMRELQPELLINNRLGFEGHGSNEETTGESRVLGDFGTPEHRIVAEDRLWESCQTSTSRLWGYAAGEHWRTPEQLLDFLCEAAQKGGNLLLNVGPDANGMMPAQFLDNSRLIGDWLHLHGEAVYGTQRGDIVEFVTRGWQTGRDNNLYLILRFWDGSPQLQLRGLANRVVRAQLLTTGQELQWSQCTDDAAGRVIKLRGLPCEKLSPLFPVIKLELDGPPTALSCFRDRLWSGDAARMTDWARGEM